MFFVTIHCRAWAAVWDEIVTEHCGSGTTKT